MDTPALHTPLTLFIVDDNPVDVYLMRWVLDAHELDYHLCVIDNGDHALAVFDRLAQQERLRSPTIILLDLNLPQVDGKEILRHVKAIPLGSEIRVVVVTSSTQSHRSTRHASAGGRCLFCEALPSQRVYAARGGH